jgi:replication factor A1
MQFRADEELLSRKDIAFEGWMDTDKIRKQIARHGTASGETNRIQDLRPGMKKVNVEAEIIEIAKPLPLRTQYGNNVVLTNAWVADQTGKIRLCLWNEQADFIKLGDAIQMKNVSVSSFKGEKQLRLGKKGTMNIMQNAIPNVNREPAQTSRNMLFA